MSKTQSISDAGEESVKDKERKDEAKVKTPILKRMELKERIKHPSKFRGVTMTRSVNDVMSKFETNSGKDVKSKKITSGEHKKDAGKGTGEEIETDDKKAKGSDSGATANVANADTSSKKSKDRDKSENNDVITSPKSNKLITDTKCRETKEIQTKTEDQSRISDKYTTKHERNKLEAKDTKRGTQDSKCDKENVAAYTEKKTADDNKVEKEADSCKEKDKIKSKTITNGSAKSDEKIDDEVQTSATGQSKDLKNRKSGTGIIDDKSDTGLETSAKVENRSAVVLKSEAKLVMRLTPSPDRRSQTPTRIIVKTKGMSAEHAKDVIKTPTDLSTSIQNHRTQKNKISDGKEDGKTIDTTSPLHSTKASTDLCVVDKDSDTVTKKKVERKVCEDAGGKTKISPKHERWSAMKNTIEPAKSVKSEENVSKTDFKTQKHPDTLIQTNHKPDDGEKLNNVSETRGETRVTNGDGGSITNRIAQWVITDKVRKEPQSSRKFDMKTEILAENKDVCNSQEDVPLSKRVALWQTQSRNKENGCDKGCMEDVRKEIENELQNARGVDEQDGDVPLSSRFAQWKTQPKTTINGPSKGCMDDVRKEIAAQRGFVEEGEDTSLGNLVSNWQKKADEHQLKQMINPFSDWTGASHRSKLSKDDENYGRPVEGSETERRGKEAENYIKKETEKLCEVIRFLGDKDDDGTVTITFGKLFNAYETISDKVVGILMRARKRQQVDFEGEMLYQNRDENVVIKLRSETMSVS